MGKRGSKESAQRQHFKRRMFSRFGIEVGDKEIEDIVRMIQTGQTSIIDKQSIRVTIHQIIYYGMKINIPYDKQRKVPITALFDDETWDDMMYN